jgi:hypothetical protein
VDAYANRAQTAAVETGVDPGFETAAVETGVDPGFETAAVETGVDPGFENSAVETGVDPGFETVEKERRCLDTLSRRYLGGDDYSVAMNSVRCQDYESAAAVMHVNATAI